MVTVEDGRVFVTLPVLSTGCCVLIVFISFCKKVIQFMVFSNIVLAVGSRILLKLKKRSCLKDVISEKSYHFDFLCEKNRFVIHHLKRSFCSAITVPY